VQNVIVQVGGIDGERGVFVDILVVSSMRLDPAVSFRKRELVHDLV
jgi:hypothetical protein